AQFDDLVMRDGQDGVWNQRTVGHWLALAASPRQRRKFNKLYRSMSSYRHAQDAFEGTGGARSAALRRSGGRLGRPGTSASKFGGGTETTALTRSVRKRGAGDLDSLGGAGPLSVSMLASMHLSSDDPQEMYELYRRDGVWTCCVCYYTQESRWAKTCEMCHSPNPFLGDGPEMELTPKWYAQLFGPTIVGVDLPRSSLDSMRKLKSVASSVRKRGNKTPGSSGWLDDEGSLARSAGGGMGEGGTWRDDGDNDDSRRYDDDDEPTENRRGWNSSGSSGSPKWARRRSSRSPARRSSLRRSSSASSDLGGSGRRSPKIRYSASSPSHLGSRRRAPRT
ncbi:MAG: hypothetical protein VX747_14190, partial [Actinomycetota bacterium]|nr:hypothetical protein [Actinomycetota bacterium]